jgi:ATPase subunit of ABC transporter with duplicated ATPase domains
MTEDVSESAPRDELKDLEEQIAELRSQAQEARRRVGQGWDSPTDQAEIATELQGAEEAEAFMRALEARRDGVLEKLGIDPVRYRRDHGELSDDRPRERFEP